MLGKILDRLRRLVSRGEEAVIVPKMEVVMEDSLLRLYPRPPHKIFVASSKGGVGKSLVSTGISTIIGLSSTYRPVLVDIDVDNRTASTVMIDESINPKRLEEVSTFVSIIAEGGSINRLRAWPEKYGTVTRRGGVEHGVVYVVPSSIPFLNGKGVINTYRRMEAHEISTAVKNFLEFVERRVVEKPELVFIFDAKPKGIEPMLTEPVYSHMYIHSDLIIYVATPEDIDYTEALRIVGGRREKSLIVLNRVRRSDVERTAFIHFISRLIDDGIPIVLIPHDPEVEVEYGVNRRQVLKHTLKTRVAPHISMIPVLTRHMSARDLDRLGLYDPLELLSTRYSILWGRE